MKNTLIFKSLGHTFLYDSHKSYLFYIHPIIERINDLYEQECEQEISIDSLLNEFKKLSREEIEYYVKKHLYLKENNFFLSTDYKDKLSGNISSEVVKNQLSNLDNLVFQVTNDCNLQCKYCCYGSLYENPNEININFMSFETARKIIDYLCEFWNSNKSFSKNNKIGIGFYGGEPLLNFELISNIILYLESLNLKNTPQFVYNMTTNGMLLDRYMDYLVNHDFSLLLSLDGNEIHDQFRVDKNNKASFGKVYQNIKNLQKLYPIFFKKKVNFNSLLNSTSSIDEIYNFIFDEFGKVPSINSISTVGLKKEKIDEFSKLYHPYKEEQLHVKMLNEKSVTQKDMGFFFYYHLGNSYKQYCDLLINSQGKYIKVPSGTCIPFFKKMFVTAEGHILACERIGLEHVLGKIGDEVYLDFDKIANYYNRYYTCIKQQCVHCFRADDCPECFFQFPFTNKMPVCQSVFGEEDQKKHLELIVSNLEKNPCCFENVNKMVFA